MPDGRDDADDDHGQEDDRGVADVLEAFLEVVDDGPRRSVGRSIRRGSSSSVIDQAQPDDGGQEAQGVDERTPQRRRTRAIASPAAAGPMTRAPLNIAELSATALPTSLAPDELHRERLAHGHVDRIGDPEQERQQDDHPDLDDAGDDERGEDEARTIIATCAEMRTLRFGSASAATPAKRPSTMTGRNWAVATIPSQIGSPVSSRTSQAWATCCIQVPMSEIGWPAKNSR